MIQRYKVQKLLRQAGGHTTFLDRLTISDTEESTLLEVRRIVRSALRSGFKEVRDRFQHSDDSDEQYIAKLRPKFWTQGSFAYKTLNDPAVVPPQQIDLDDGVYFPMEFVENNPRAAKSVLFRIVDDVLRDLAEQRGWKFDGGKPTCSRLLISEKIHMDIPIYAIPEARYEVLKESMDARANSAMFSGFFMDEDEIPLLDPNQVYLAMRDKEHWKASDPMDIHEWFKNECRVHTNRLRYVCRYLKAWRDYQWPEGGGPSSISLMVAAAQTFDRNLNGGNSPFDSDCTALLHCAQALPQQFQSGIYNPTNPEEKMFPRSGLSLVEFEGILQSLHQLKSSVEEGLCQSSTNEEVVESLILVFGPRVPKRPDWVEGINVATSVRKSPARKQNRPEPPESMRSASYRSA